jgi:hypothetical protein
MHIFNMMLMSAANAQNLEDNGKLMVGTLTVLGVVQIYFEKTKMITGILEKLICTHNS